MFMLPLCLLLGSPLLGPAFADETTDARAKELYENGAELYDEGRYDDAVAAWEEAYRLSGRALLLYNIANAQERAGHYVEALEQLNRYRAFATADERDILDRRIRNLEKRIDESGGTPAPTTATPVSTTPTTTAPTTTAPVTTAAVTTSTAVEEKPERKGPPLPTYILGGVGVLGLASGAIFGLQATTARTEAEGFCQKTDEQKICPIEAQDAIARDKTDALIADISLGVGGAGIISAVIFALLDAPVAFVPTGSGGMLSVGGSF